MLVRGVVLQTVTERDRSKSAHGVVALLNGLSDRLGRPLPSRILFDSVRRKLEFVT